MISWQPYCESLKRAVQKVESGSAVELVVVLQRHSGYGRGFFHGLGLLAVVLGAVFLVHSPWDFPPEILVPVLILGYMIGPALGHFFPNLPIRWLGRQRLRETLLNQARVRWMADGLANTRARSSALLLLSPQEREATWIFDLGVERAVPVGEILNSSLSWSRSSPEAFLQAAQAGVEALAPLFAEKLPREEDDTNELSDEVSIVAAPVL